VQYRDDRRKKDSRAVKKRMTRDFATFWNFKMACAKPKSETESETETEMSSRSRERASLDK
jgi:hypothetical protein